jgi:hypothetical protein
MKDEMEQPEFPYFVKIETAAGRSQTVPIAFLTRTEVEHFLQTDFKRLVEEAGMTGVSVHIERPTTVDYEAVLREVAACLRNGSVRAAA